MEAGHLLESIHAGCAPVILDVRSRREFDRGHVPGALHIPFWTLSRRRIGDIPASADDPVVVYCGHGPRAHLAVAVLRRHGFKRAACLAGHISKWREAGLPEESSVS